MAGILLAAPCFGGESRWLKFRSPGFELLTDAGASNGREVLRRMEQIRHVFESRTRRTNLTPLPVRIYVFRSEAAFRPFQVNESAAGYYQPGADRDYIAMQVAGSDLYRVVFHEYVHLLMRHAGFPLPVWFNEGTAEVYSTTDLSGGEIRIGRMIPVHLAALRSEKLLDMGTLLSVDHSSPHYNEREKTGIFYAESWALVHMLNFSPQYQPGMPNFVSMLFAGEDPARAMQQAFGRSPAAVLSDLTAYIRRDRFAGIRFEAQKLEGISKPAAETVPELDGELALVDLLLAIRRSGPAGEILAKLDPALPEVQVALGDAAVQEAQDIRARDHYRRAMQLGSRSARLRYDYAMLLRELNAPEAEIVDALRQGTELDPKLFDAQYLLGYMLLKSGNFGEAASHLRIAGGLQPWRCAVWEHLALALHYGGKQEEALSAAEKARTMANTPEDVSRAEGTLRLVKSKPEPIVHTEPISRPRQEHWADSAPVARIEGLLTQVDCLGQRARLQVVSNGRRVFLLVRDPGAVTLRNAGGVWTEFACGPVPNRTVVVDFRKVANTTYGTEGEVAAIEFR